MDEDTGLSEGLLARASPSGSAVAGAVSGVYAALDLGTNNCRLLIARPSGDGFRVVDSFSRIIRLGEGISATGCISDAAIERIDETGEQSIELPKLNELIASAAVMRPAFSRRTRFGRRRDGSRASRTRRCRARA